MSLSVVDISSFTFGSDEQRCSIARLLVESLKQHGFVKVCNHGLSSEDVNALLALSREFFALPAEQKTRIAYTGGHAPSRGYIGLGHERTSKKSPFSTASEDTKDPRESVDFGSPWDTEYPNAWLDEADLPGFRHSVEAYYDICQRVSLNILQALELGLGAPSGSLTCRSTPDSSELRLNHYPAVEVQELKAGTVRRAWPHTDVGIITLLLQDHVGGLELEDRQKPGTYLPVSSNEPTDMIINVADTLERWTNGVLKAGLHQVNISDDRTYEDNAEVPARSSIVFFFKANASASAGPIPHFVTPQEPARYSETTALEYLQQVNGKLYEY